MRKLKITELNRISAEEFKHIKPLRQKVQYQCPCQIFAVWKNIPLQQTKELFQHNYQLYIMPQR